jgi:hypothetical protein
VKPSPKVITQNVYLPTKVIKQNIDQTVNFKTDVVNNLVYPQQLAPLQVGLGIAPPPLEPEPLRRRQFQFDNNMPQRALPQQGDPDPNRVWVDAQAQANAHLDQYKVPFVVNNIVERKTVTTIQSGSSSTSTTSSETIQVDPKTGQYKTLPSPATQKSGY